MYQNTYIYSNTYYKHNAQGQFLCCFSKCFNGLLNAKEAEAIGMREAILWVMQQGVDHVIFETDAKSTVDALNNHETDISEFGSIISECRDLLNQVLSFKYSFVRREANVIAHSLARESRYYGGFQQWQDPPNFIEGLLTDVVSFS